MLLAASSAAVSGSRALGSAPKAGSALGGSRGAGALRRVSYAAGARAAPSRRSPTFRAAVVAVQEYHSEAASGVAVTFTLIDKKVIGVGCRCRLALWTLCLSFKSAQDRDQTGSAACKTVQGWAAARRAAARTAVQQPPLQQPRAQSSMLLNAGHTFPRM